jgi:hypothetical protein
VHAENPDKNDPYYQAGLAASAPPVEPSQAQSGAGGAARGPDGKPVKEKTFWEKNWMLLLGAHFQSYCPCGSGL